MSNVPVDSPFFEGSNSARSQTAITKGKSVYQDQSIDIPPESPTRDPGLITRDPSTQAFLRKQSYISYKQLPPSSNVYAWGSAELGQAGLPASTVALPQRVVALADKDVVEVAASSQHSCVVTSTGELYTFGGNHDGQLGVKRIADKTHVPVRVAALESHIVTQAVTGEQHTLALTSQGKVAGWGCDEFGQTGLSEGVTVVTLPRILKIEYRVVQIAAGGSHSLALTSSGQVLSFGSGCYGQLGHGTQHNVYQPTPVLRLWSVGVVQVQCGENHSTALSIDGSVYTWGFGKYGQLGHGDTSSSPVPQPVKALAKMLGVQACCGDNSTLLLTASGQVFCWGENAHGQLGLAGHTGNVYTPTQIPNIPVIIQVATGQRHTLMLTEEQRVLAVGSNQEGQLGQASSEEIVQKPTPVQNLENQLVVLVCAGGTHSLVVTLDPNHAQGDPADWVPGCRGKYGSSLLPVKLPIIKQELQVFLSNKEHNEQGNSKQQNEVMRIIQDIWENPAYLLGGFTLPIDSKHNEAHSMDGAVDEDVLDHRLDIDAIQSIYADILLTYDTQIINKLTESCINVLDHARSMLTAAQRRSGECPKEGEWLKMIIVILMNPLNSGATGPKILQSLCKLSVELTKTSQMVLAKWFQRFPAEVFGARFVRPMQHYVTHILTSDTTDNMTQIEWDSVKRREFLTALLFLDILYEANEQAGNLIPFQEFYNRTLDTKANLREEYMTWSFHKQTGDAEPERKKLRSVCQMPFILSPEAKARILQGEAQMLQQREVHGSFINAVSQGLPMDIITEGVFLDIRVRRQNILQDALNQLMSRRQDFKKPLRVTFIMQDGTAEMGQDEGGPSKEFFQLLVPEIFNENYGMFKFSDETRQFWFSNSSFETQEEFRLVGMILGLAIYNGVILDVQFPMVVYKKLQGLKAGFCDLEQAFPQLGAGLKQLLNFDGDVENVFCRAFEVEYEYFGDTQVEQLKPGGSRINVTNENRKEYVDLYTDWVLNKSIKQQFEAFSKGFHDVCGGPAIQLNRHEELELLICGLPHLDFAQLREGSKYDAGYADDQPYIQKFWEYLYSMSIDEKRRFLKFCTGSDRSPVGGLLRLNFTIQRAGPDTERLPTSHTCFNVLLLPEYSSIEKLKIKIQTAIDNAQGFGLK